MLFFHIIQILRKQKKIEDAHNGVASIQLNLIDEDSVKNCIAKISEDHNGINTVVNAAGFNIPQNIYI